MTQHANLQIDSAVLARLKAETRADHDAVEALLDWTRPDLTLADYRRVLTRFYGFYAPVERALSACFPWYAYGLDPAEREKTLRLETDLRALGVRDVHVLPRCRALPALRSDADAFGCLYVLEGATLGGRVVLKMLERSLGIDRGAAGARFFNGYGESTSAMWQAFRQALTRHATDEARRDRTVAAARATFQSMHRWLAQDAVR